MSAEFGCVFFFIWLKKKEKWQVYNVCSAWEGRKCYRVFPYLIVIWFVVRKRLAVTVDSFLGFSSALVDGFHLSAKFRVLRVEVLISS